VDTWLAHNAHFFNETFHCDKIVVMKYWLKSLTLTYKHITQFFLPSIDGPIERVLDFIFILFIMCSHQVPNGLSKFPTCSQYQYASCLMLSSRNLYRWVNIGINMFLYLEWIPLYLGIFEIPNFFLDGPIK
jgi:hypothetical protein